MPTTYNGIGTHYYGKKNRSSRTAACRSCRRVGVLDSYDTRLWVVVVFIPVIPLGRKRIIDSCPACTRHFAAAADTYEQARQLQTSGSMDRYRREPSPPVALEAHAQLLSFHEYDQAAEFRKAALDRFPDHAALRAGLAAHLDQVSSYDVAGRLYEEALEIEPDLPEARAGVAQRMMARGELDEARELLDFLEVPGAGQHHPLGPLDQLSSAYQARGRHEEALVLSEHLLREIPKAGQIHGFRAFVRKSEKALRRPETILPPREHSLRGLLRKEGSPYPAWQRRVVFWGLGLTLLAAGLFLNNDYIRRHRKIHVINAAGRPVQVAVDDGPPTEVVGQGLLTVAEGTHRIRVAGAVDDSYDVELQSGFFDRWFRKPLWVLNPGGEAAFEDSTLFYAEQPQPANHRVVVGKPFIALAHVDYPFEAPPHTLQMKKGSGPVTKTAFERAQVPDDQAFAAALTTDRAAALDFAERRLPRNPEQGGLLAAYLRESTGGGAARAEAFLKSGLDLRPVSVHWHRAYQTLDQLKKPDASLLDLYGRYLAAEPTNSALLYLRGRIEPDEKAQQDFYRRSIEADPKSPWPWMALGAHAEAHADWAGALRCFRKARELKIDEDLIAERMHIARLASGEAPALVDEYKARLMSRPLDPSTLVFLCDALAASGQADKIESEMAAWGNRLPPGVWGQVGPLIRPVGLYLAGNLEECAQASRMAPDVGGMSYLAHALLGLGRAREVAEDKALGKVWDDPFHALALSLGLSLDGREEDAARWRERAIPRLESSFDEVRRVAKALRATEPVPVSELERVVIDPTNKALVFAVLGRRFSGRRAEYNAEAARYNVRRKPSYQLVRRALEAPTPKAP